MLRHALLVSASLAASPVFAQTTPEAPVETIVVTAILSNDSNPINPVRLPQSARISSQTLTAEDAQKLQARDVFDLLNYGTGVFTTTSGRKAPANLNIRGDGNFAFIIDGAYIPPQLASRILQVIPASAIEEVRIVRTSTALTINPLVGIATPSGAANNGFIVVRTRTPTDTQALISFQIGSFRSAGANAVLGTTFKAGSATGYVQAIGSTFTGDGPDGFNLDKRFETLGLKGGIALDAASLDLSVLKSWAGYGIVQGNDRLRPSVSDDLWRLDPINSLIATANGTLRWDTRNTTLLTLAYTESKGAFVTQDEGVNNRLVRRNDNSFWNAAFRHNLFLGATKFQAGADYVHWDNPSGQYYYEGIPREEKVWGLFLQADQSLFDNRLNLDIGGRLDRVEIVRGIDYYQPGQGPRPDVRVIKNEKLPWAKFVSAGASFKATPDWLLNARYGYSSQAPRTGVVLADPTQALQGESRNKWELGVEGRLADWIRPSLNAFFIDVQNEVTPIRYAVVGGEQVALYGNTDSRRTGMEAILAGRWEGGDAPGGYRASVTHYFNVLDPTGLLARTQPRTVTELTFDQSKGPWRMVGAAKYVSGYESNAFTRCPNPNPNCLGGVTSPFLPIGDYVNIDFNISRVFRYEKSSFRVTASVKNLLDDNFETSVGFPSIGRQFGLELAAAF